MKLDPIAVLALSVPSFLAVGCTRTEESRPQETQTTAAEKPTVESVKNDPSRFYGQKLTLTGEVDDVKDPRNFKLEGNRWLFSDEIRVLARSPVKLGGAPLEEDDDVVVTGTLRKFSPAEIERELGWDIPAEMEAELRDKPVLVAEEIRKVESAAAWTSANPEGEIVGIVALATAADPSTLVGQRIRLQGEPVRSVQGKGFWVGPSHGEQTFVVPPAGTDISTIKAGERVDLTGTIKKTPPTQEALKNWGLPETSRGVIEHEPVYIEAMNVKSVGPAKKTMKPNAPQPGTKHAEGAGKQP